MQLEAIQTLMYLHQIVKKILFYSKKNSNEASVVERGKEQELRVMRLAGALSFSDCRPKYNGKWQHKMYVMKRLPELEKSQKKKVCKSEAVTVI